MDITTQLKLNGCPKGIHAKRKTQQTYTHKTNIILDTVKVSRRIEENMDLDREKWRNISSFNQSEERE